MLSTLHRHHRLSVLHPSQSDPLGVVLSSFLINRSRERMAEVPSPKRTRLTVVPVSATERMDERERMAEVGWSPKDEVICETTNDDLKSILEGTILLRKNGRKENVKIADLSGKIVALYFSSIRDGPSKRFTQVLFEVYKEIKHDFEVVFVSGDYDEGSFELFLSQMPWFGVRIFNAEIRHQLFKLSKVRRLPHLVILDGNGKVLSYDGVQLIYNYGAEAYPFTPKKIKQIEEEDARTNQPMSTLLGTNSRDYLISKKENKVPISNIERNTVALFFCECSPLHKPCRQFALKLEDMYYKLKANDHKFEVVLISVGYDEQDYNEVLKSVPFLAVPFMDKICDKLSDKFKLCDTPMLVMIGPDGKTLNPNATEVFEKHGIQEYPFTLERVEELAKMERRLESQPLESLMVSEGCDFVIRNNREKALVSDLVGKNILLYFSALWSYQCCEFFLPALVKAYNELRERGANFEIIFISSDNDVESFNDFFSRMPWYALPFGDQRKNTLCHALQINSIPFLVVIGPTGKTVTKVARSLLENHGPDAYPFTEERLKAIEAKIEEEAKVWPKKMEHPFHAKHELKLQKVRWYCCGKCNMGGFGWSYCCKECCLDLHPRCAFEKK